MPRRSTRLDRILSHLDRVVGPPDAIAERLEEIDELVSRFTRYLPRPPLPPLPGIAVRDDAEKACVLAFYSVLREKYGEEEARRIVEEAAKRYRR